MKAIVFDLGNVIINLKEEKLWWQENFAAILQEDRLLELRKSGFFHEYEKGNFSNDDFLSGLHQISKFETVTKDDVKNAWISLLADIPPSRIDLLRQLASKYPLYLLSNTNDIHLDFILDELLKSYGKPVFDEVFSKCFYSQKIKLAKPDIAIYQHVLDSIDRAPEEILFLDDKQENLDAAHSLGIQTALVTPYKDIHFHLKDML